MFVIFRLNKKIKLEISYKSRNESLKSTALSLAKGKKLKIEDVYKAVIMIRRNKLPDPSLIPNAGSFFKNLIVTKKVLTRILKKIPDIKYYKVSYGHGKVGYKIPAGWMLDSIGWKNKWVGNCGTWKNQALIVVTNGKATSNEMLRFITLMQHDFYENFGFYLEPEVVLV